MNQLPHPHCLALATLLLDAGADPNDAQALYNRHFKANDDHLTLLLSYGLGQGPGGPWYKRMPDQSTTPSQLLTEELATAVGRHRAERVRLLVEHGADVNTPSVRGAGRTPYEIALRSGSVEIAEYLVRHGARTVELEPSRRSHWRASPAGAMRCVRVSPTIRPFWRSSDRMDVCR
jgi:hypothetical protein